MALQQMMALIGPDLVGPVQKLLKGRGTLRDVEKAIQDGADVNHWEGPLTPVRCAVQANHLRLLRLLLQNKADPDAKDSKGVSALHVATFDGRTTCMTTLLEFKADVNIRDRHEQTPLFFTPTAKSCEILVQRQADVNAVNDKHQLAVHLAAHAGLTDTMKCLGDHTGEHAWLHEDIRGRNANFYHERSKAARQAKNRSLKRKLQPPVAAISAVEAEEANAKALPEMPQAAEDQTVEEAPPSPAEERRLRVLSLFSTASRDGQLRPAFSMLSESHSGAQAVELYCSRLIQVTARKSEKRASLRIVCIQEPAGLDEAAKDNAADALERALLAGPDEAAKDNAADALERALLGQAEISPSEARDRARILLVSGLQSGDLSSFLSQMQQAQEPGEEARDRAAAALEMALLGPDEEAIQRAMASAATRIQRVQRGRSARRRVKILREDAAESLRAAYEADERLQLERAREKAAAEQARLAEEALRAAREEEALAKDRAEAEVVLEEAAAQAFAAQEQPPSPQAVIDDPEAERHRLAAIRIQAAHRGQAGRTKAAKAKADAAIRKRRAAEEEAYKAKMAQEEANRKRRLAEEEAARKAEVAELAQRLAEEQAKLRSEEEAEKRRLEEEYKADLEQEAAIMNALRRPSKNKDAFTIKLDRSGGQLLGVNIDFLEDGQTLLVESLEDGLVKAWNDAHLDQPQVMAGDRILQVNEAKGEAMAIVGAMRESETLEITFCRPPDIPKSAKPATPSQQTQAAEEVWSKYWDVNYARYYYHNESTGETTWERPGSRERRRDAEARSLSPSAMAASASSPSAASPKGNLAGTQSSQKSLSPVMQNDASPQKVQEAGIRIQGATGQYAHVINGVYQLQTETYDGVHLYRRAGGENDANWWMLRFPNGIWHVTNTQRKQSGKTGGLMFATKAAQLDPRMAGPWRVFSGTAWEEQDISIMQVGPASAQVVQQVVADAAPPKPKLADVESEADLGPVEKTERDGCMFWEVILQKKQESDKFGFVPVNGKVDFETRLFQRITPGPLTESSVMSGLSASEEAPLQGPELLVVHKIVTGGLLHQWNQAHPEAEVVLFDRICNVNGETTIEGMQREVKSNRVHMQVMRYPESFMVSFHKRGRKLGFRFERPTPGSATTLINELMSGGAVPEWNTQQVSQNRWHYAVLPDMHIESCNDVGGDSYQIVAELKRCEDCILQLQRAERVAPSVASSRAGSRIHSARQTPRQSRGPQTSLQQEG